MNESTRQPYASRFTSSRSPAHRDHNGRYSTFASTSAGSSPFYAGSTRSLPTVSTTSAAAGHLPLLSTATQSRTSSQLTVEAFLGVPYAQPPVGNLRFLPPVSPAHWRGVRLADRLAPVCIQRLPAELLKAAGDSNSSSIYEHNVFAEVHRSSPYSSSSSSFSSFSSSTSSSQRNRNQDTSSTTSSSFDRLGSAYRLVEHLRNQSEDCLNLNIYLPFNHRGKLFDFAFISNI